MCIFFFSTPPRGRTWPVSLGSGLGLGMGYSNCQHDFRSPYLIHGRVVKVSTGSQMSPLFIGLWHVDTSWYMVTFFVCVLIFRSSNEGLQKMRICQGTTHLVLSCFFVFCGVPLWTHVQQYTGFYQKWSWYIFNKVIMENSLSYPPSLFFRVHVLRRKKCGLRVGGNFVC